MGRSSGGRRRWALGAIGLGLVASPLHAAPEVTGHAEIAAGTNYLWRGQPSFNPTVTATFLYDNSLSLSGLGRWKFTAGLWNGVSERKGSDWHNPYLFTNFQVTEKLSLEAGYQIFASPSAHPHDAQHEVWGAAAFRWTEAIRSSLYLGADPVRRKGYYAGFDATLEADLWRFTLEMNPALGISRYQSDSTVQLQHLSLEASLTYPLAEVGFFGPLGQLAWSGRDDKLWAAAALTVGVSND